jgi:hypothetical protein
VAVVPQDWQPGPVTIVEEADGVTLATSAATAHLSLIRSALGLPTTPAGHSRWMIQTLGWAGSRHLEMLVSRPRINLER